MQPRNVFAVCEAPRIVPPGDDSKICEALRLVESKLSIGAWTWDLISDQSYWTPGLYRLLDLDPATTNPSRSSFEQVMHPGDRRLTHDFDKALAEGMPFDRQFRIIRRNGSVRWVRCITEARFDRAGKPSRAVGVVQDITDHQEALEVERIWQERYCALLRAVKSPIWTSRPDDPYTVDVENLDHLPGKPERTRFLGYAWKTTIHPDDLKTIMQAWETAYKTHEPFEFETRVQQADGAYRWIRSRVAPILNRDGSVRGWVGTSDDINAEKDWSCPGKRQLTGAQIRGARGILNWSVRDLADRAGISPAVIRRLEERDDAPAEPEQANTPLRAALEKGGVQFLFPPVGKPGVRPV
ncbi:MAG: PAS domain-containing protein [Xanthobacteraceae bacterium]